MELETKIEQKSTTYGFLRVLSCLKHTRKRHNAEIAYMINSKVRRFLKPFSFWLAICTNVQISFVQSFHV